MKAPMKAPMNLLSRLMNGPKRKAAVALAALSVLLLATAADCEESDGDKAEREFTERSQAHFNVAQPPHQYDASQARDNLIGAQDAMALGADSWTVQYIEGVGITFQCPSVGFPIPFGSQITNPEKIVNDSDGGDLTVPQQEPYGLYVPQDVPATYANCVLPDGSIGVFYSEPALTTFLFDVNCDAARKSCTIADDAKATVKVSKVDPGKVNVRNAKPETGE